MEALTRDTVAEACSREQFFDELVRKSYRQSFSLACRLTGNVAEAQDLVQESYVRAYRFFSRYDDSLPFTSWLYRIMANVNIDRARRRSRLKTMSLDQAGADGATSWDLPDSERGTENAIFDRALDGPLQSGLMSLNHQFRTAVLLADVECLGYEEIAEIMGTSVGTVRSRIHRGRRHLRNYLMRHHAAAYGSMANEL